MLNNKKRDFTPFDMKKHPSNQNLFIMPLVWGASYIMTRQFGLKIKKENMQGLKPPYLVYSTHQGFSDYYIAPLALFPHRANYVSDMEGFAAFGEGLYRSLGCIGKRRFEPDVSVIMNIRYAIKKGRSVVIFPESRHSNIGTTARIPKNLGRLAKMLGVNVLVLSAHGSYLANPFWDEERTRKTKMEATLRCICRADELHNVDSDELQSRIEQFLDYDEYAWQQHASVKIKEKFRAEGIHKPLYICHTCGSEYYMKSNGDTLYCEKCGAKWILSEDGMLIGHNETIDAPKWYEWQKSFAIGKIKQAGNLEYSVRVEALPNSKGFISMGQGKLLLNDKEFTLLLDNEILHFSHAVRESVQTEYNYRGRGMCIVLSSRDCCYYIYSDDINFNPTEIQFIGEYLYDETS